MEPKQALELLTNALNLANTKGVFNLADSAQIFSALTSVGILVQKEIDENEKSANKKQK